MLSAVQSTTKSPTLASSSGPELSWTNPTNVYTDNGSSATIGFSMGGEIADDLVFNTFDFDIPTNAVIEGVYLSIDGSFFSVYGSVNLSSDLGSGTSKTLTGTTYGGSEDLWGLALTPAVVNDSNFGGTLFVGDVSGGDGTASVDHIEITVYWRYDITADPIDVPTRFLYKVFTNQGEYLGNLPKVISEFAFTQDINSNGSQLSIDLGLSVDTSALPNEYILTEDGDVLTDENDNPLFTEGFVPLFAFGDSDVSGKLIKNGNRVVVYQFDYYYPNGKLMFTGQINQIRINLAEESIRLKVLHDGMDLDNYIARGSPFDYTDDATNITGTSYVEVNQIGALWERYGQDFVISGSIDNIGAVKFRMLGSANVTVYLYDGVNGILLGSSTSFIDSAGVIIDAQVGFATPIDVAPGSSCFFAVGVGSGQSIRLYYSSADPYASGAMYHSSYGGGGGGQYFVVAGSDLVFTIQSAEPTTTTTYSLSDPTTEMLVPIIEDYNLRGGLITTDDEIDATGLSLTYTFNTNTILDAVKAILRMSPNGFYYTVDLGTNELTFKSFSQTADYTLVKGRHIENLELVMSIENVKNQYYFSGGDIGGGVNLYKEFTDTTSRSLYGNRLERKSDNRVTVDATATAIGESFIEEFSDEQFETSVTITTRTMDITLLTPGKVIGFSGFGTIIDTLLLQIVSRSYTAESVTLTLGTLPPRFTPLIEEINRGLIAQETVANPTAPS